MDFDSLKQMVSHVYGCMVWYVMVVDMSKKIIRIDKVLVVTRLEKDQMARIQS